MFLAHSIIKTKKNICIYLKTNIFQNFFIFLTKNRNLSKKFFIFFLQNYLKIEILAYFIKKSIFLYSLKIELQHTLSKNLKMLLYFYLKTKTLKNFLIYYFEIKIISKREIFDHFIKKI